MSYQLYIQYLPLMKRKDKYNESYNLYGAYTILKRNNFRFMFVNFMYIVSVI